MALRRLQEKHDGNCNDRMRSKTSNHCHVRSMVSEDLFRYGSAVRCFDFPLAPILWVMSRKCSVWVGVSRR